MPGAAIEMCSLHGTRLKPGAVFNLQLTVHFGFHARLACSEPSVRVRQPAPCAPCNAIQCAFRAQQLFLASKNTTRCRSKNEAIPTAPWTFTVPCAKFPIQCAFRASFFIKNIRHDRAFWLPCASPRRRTVWTMRTVWTIRNPCTFTRTVLLRTILHSFLVQSKWVSLRPYRPYRPWHWQPSAIHELRSRRPV